MSIGVEKGDMRRGIGHPGGGREGGREGGRGGDKRARRIL